MILFVLIFVFVCRRAVSILEGKTFAAEHNLLFVEASAKTAEGVQDAFLLTATNVWEKMAQGRVSYSRVDVSHRLSHT